MEWQSWLPGEGLDLETTIESDSAPLHILVENLMQTGSSLHVLRDVTRGVWQAF